MLLTRLTARPPASRPHGNVRARTAVRVALAVYYAAYAVWFLTSDPDAPHRTFVSDGAYLPLGVAGVAGAAWAAVRARGRDRTVWVLLAVALALRLQGDASWWWLEAVRRQEPYPSVADVGFSLFYPVVVGALALMPVRTQSRRAGVGNLLDVLAMTGSAFMLIWYLVLGTAVQAGVAGGFGSLEGRLNVTYPLWDLLLLLGAGRVVLRGSDPRWTIATRWIIAGALLFVVADVGFTYMSSHDGFTGGEWLDLFWVAAQSCFAQAAYSPPGEDATPQGSDRHAHLLPVVAVVASYTVVAKVAVDLPLYPAGGVLLADLLITVVVLGRQLVAVADHRALARRYQTAASTDALTGLGTRRHVLEQAAELLAQSRPRPCAAVMVDVDHFKQVNDRYGHLAGDAALRAVAEHLRRSVRGTDLLARFGGDEFVAFLVGVDAVQAAAVVARMDASVDVAPHLSPAERAGDVPAVSLSIGWAGGEAATLTGLLAQADLALYAAKSGGRGRAVGAHELGDDVPAPAPPPAPPAVVTG